MTGDLRRYERDGYVVVAGVLDPLGVEACREHLGLLKAKRAAPAAPAVPAAAAAAAGCILAVVPGSDPFLDGMAADPRLAGLASDLLGSEAACFGCTYMLKEPFTGPPALWHQDGHPWQTQLNVATAVTLWIALDDVDAGNGALQVIPGSHRVPAQPLVAVEGEAGGMFGAGMDAEELEPFLSGTDRAAAGRVIELAAGDVSAHHPWLIHASGPNRSGRQRRALALRYRPAES